MWKREENSSFLQGNVWNTTWKPKDSDIFPQDPKLYPVLSTTWNENDTFFIVFVDEMVSFLTHEMHLNERSERLQFSSTIQ